MDKTLKISFSLKNTYRVNSILYSLKQLPVVKKVLPEALYCSKAVSYTHLVGNCIFMLLCCLHRKILHGYGHESPEEAI